MSTRSPSSQTILLVDDEDQVRSVVAIMLRRVGYQVIEAASGEEALTLFQQRAAEITVLVSDLVMPGMQGPALAQRLIGDQPDLYVVFISGYSDALPAAALNHRRMAFLAKPFRATELVAKIEELIGRSSDPAAS